MKLTISPQVYIPLWAQFPNDFHPVFFSKSKVDKTDAAVSMTVEWARCFPVQTLPEQ